jgi:hypothetical protein
MIVVMVDSSVLEAERIEVKCSSQFVSSLELCIERFDSKRWGWPSNITIGDSLRFKNSGSTCNEARQLALIYMRYKIMNHQPIVVADMATYIKNELLRPKKQKAGVVPAHQGYASALKG